MEHIPPARAAAFVAGKDDLHMAGLALDSLARMELLITLETEHGVSITPDELASFDSIAAIATHIANKPPRPANTADPLPATPLASTPPASPTADLPDCARLYRRAFSGCRSINTLNKLHIDLDHRLTPAEFITLQGLHHRGQLVQAQPAFAAAISTWLGNTLQWMAASGKTAPEPYTRSWLAPAVLVYQGPGARSDKTLLVCFTTRGRRMMIPHAVLLQHFDATAVDVVIVADPRRSSFATGVPLLGDSLLAVFGWLAQALPLDAYQRVRALGCSGGGYAAALAPYYLPMDLGVSVGGRFAPGQYHLRLGMLARAWRAARRGRPGHALLAFGADKTRDRKFAKWMARAAGGHLLAAETPGEEVGHLVLYTLLVHGGLGAFLGHTVLAELADMQARPRLESRCFGHDPA